jgi:hypothetical protein
MGYATGLGRRRSAASPALSARRPATVFLRIAIIEAPPAMPLASVLGDNAPAPAEPAVHTWRMVTFRREIRLRHETGVTQRALSRHPKAEPGADAGPAAPQAPRLIRERSNSATPNTKDG